MTKPSTFWWFFGASEDDLGRIHVDLHGHRAVQLYRRRSDSDPEKMISVSKGLKRKKPRHSPGLQVARGSCLRALHVHCVEALRALLHLESDFVTFHEVGPGSGLVDENVLTTFFWGDETETFLRVEELHCTA